MRSEETGLTICETAALPSLECFIASRNSLKGDECLSVTKVYGPVVNRLGLQFHSMCSEICVEVCGQNDLVCRKVGLNIGMDSSGV
jgi:hypothetical protein